MSRFALSSCVPVFSRLAVLGLVAASLGAQPALYTIQSIAGNGTAGFSGDGAAATAAQFDTPYALATDKAGNLYIADQANNRIRKIDTSGIISTIAGDGTQFYLGDGGPAAKASLIHPLGIAIASNGDIYIADSRNHAIRKIDSTGNINPVTGTGTPGFTNEKIVTTDPNFVQPDPTTAQVNRPIGMAFDSAGNLYFADSLNQRIRKINFTAKTIETIAGNGTASYTGDGGLATAATLNYPQGVAIDSGGNIYVADGQSHVIRKITPDGNIKTVAGNHLPGYSGDGGKATNASLFYPRGISVDASGNLYIADTLNSCIRRVTEDGTITTVAGVCGSFGDSGDGGPAEQAQLLFPAGVTVGPNGTIYVVDTQNQRIKLLTPRALTPTAAPAIDSGGVISASSFGALSQAAPGSWVEIYGANFYGSTRSWATTDFVNGAAPTSLAGVSVTVGGKPAPISYVGPRQLNIQVPTGIGLGPQPVVVKTAAGTATSNITVNAVQPGLLAPAALNFNNYSYAAAQLPDGTFVVPLGSSLGGTGRPARVGETLVFYGIGFGPVTPDIASGQIPAGQTALTQPVKFFFGQTEAKVTYAGLAPGLIGLYQFNVVVPNVAIANAIPLTFTLGGQPGSQTSTYIAVGN